MFGCFLFCENKMIAGSQQSFARNAADIQAGTAEVLVLLDQCGLKAELTRANSGNVATRTGADDYDI